MRKPAAALVAVMDTTCTSGTREADVVSFCTSLGPVATVQVTTCSSRAPGLESHSTLYEDTWDPKSEGGASKVTSRDLSESMARAMLAGMAGTRG